MNAVHEALAQAQGILDLRSAAAYSAGHLPQATWLPADQLAVRLNHLPAAPAKLFLMGTAAQIEQADVCLVERGDRVSGRLLLADEWAWPALAQAHGLATQTGMTSQRLWQPSALVAEFVRDYFPGYQFNQTKPRFLDLGCGGGRDAVYLALQGAEVVAIDKEIRVLERARHLAQTHGVSVAFRCGDLNKSEDVFSVLSEFSGHFDGILGVRYLNRTLWSHLPDWLSEKGYLLWETFVDLGEPLCSPKNPNFLLKPGELAEVFSGWDRIIDRIVRLDDGRPINQFLAQKCEGRCKNDHKECL
ncbi:MAG: methyltransferase domain-containing protein [Thiotrichales bacterium]|nr:methyltransferase domain-containing protein [Thiotrichales bacterium]